MGIARGLPRAEDRGDAGVGAGKERGPVVARLRGEDRGQPFGGARPGCRGRTGGRSRDRRSGREGRGIRRGTSPPGTGPRQAAVGAGVAARPVRAVQQAFPRASASMPTGAIDIRSASMCAEPSTMAASTTVPSPVRWARSSPASMPRDQIHRAAADVADQRRGRDRRLPGQAGIPERARGGDVVQVMPGLRGARPVLAPAGHPPVDQPRIDRMHRIGAQAEAFHHAGPEPLDQGVGEVSSARSAAVGGRLEVERDGLLAAVEDRSVGHARGRRAAGRWMQITSAP
jgi:hypothetical protein